MLQVIESGTFNQWLESLKDRSARARIVKQIQRIQLAEQYVGGWKSLGSGVYECRINVGPGYRLYTSMADSATLLLLAGGDKRSQTRDIEEAKKVLREWRNEHGV